MNINTANLKVGLAASKDESRKYIQTIHFTSKFTEATNGHILARVSLPANQYPVHEIPASCPTDDAGKIIPFSVMAAPAMKIKTMKQKNKYSSIPCLEDALYIDVTATNANGSARFSATDRETTITPELQKVEGDFPELDRVIPNTETEKPCFSANFKIGSLETLLTIAKSTGAEVVTIYGLGDYRPMKIEAGANGQDFVGVIMPVRV